MERMPFRWIGDHPKPTLVILLVLVFLVRFLVAGVIAFPDRPDRALNTDQWGGVAKNLIDGYGYVGGQGHIRPEDAKPNTERGPVPVLFFAAIFLLLGHNLWPVMAGNWLCDVGVAFLLYQIARGIFPNRRYVAYTAVLFWALYIPEITITNKTFSEPLYTLLLAGHIWTMIRVREKLSWPTAVFSGVLLGAAALSRPVMLAYLPVVWLLLLFPNGFSRKTLRWEWLKKIVLVGAGLSLAFGLMLLPWIVRNYIVFDAFIPGGTLAGYNLIRNNYYLNTDNFVPELHGRGTVEAAIEEELQAQGESIVGRSPVEQDRIYRRIAFERIRAHPGRYVIVTGYRFLRLWFNVGFGVKPSTASYLVMLANGLFLILFVAAFGLFRGSWLYKSLPPMALILYTTVFHMLFKAQVRYVFPVMPYVLMFGAYTSVLLFGEGLLWTRGVDMVRDRWHA